jgi:hypothetical protein
MDQTIILVFGSNPGRETEYPDDLRGSLQFLWGKFHESLKLATNASFQILSDSFTNELPVDDTDIIVT